MRARIVAMRRTGKARTVRTARTHSGRRSGVATRWSGWHRRCGRTKRGRGPRSRPPVTGTGPSKPAESTPSGEGRGSFEEAAPAHACFLSIIASMSDTSASKLPPFGGDEAASPYDGAGVVVLPVPYEATVSYGGGTAKGPEAILRASTQVELYDEQLGREPYRAGLFTDAMLDVSGGTETVVRRIE